MDTQAELEIIDKQIIDIKNNLEYQRLLTTHRGVMDDQRFKAYTLQLQTLEIRKTKLTSTKDKVVYVPNQRVFKATTKPIAPIAAVAPQKVVPVVTVPPPKSQVKHTVHQALTNVPATATSVNMGRLKPKAPDTDGDVPKVFASFNRTMAVPTVETAVNLTSIPDDEIIMKTPSRPQAPRTQDVRATGKSRTLQKPVEDKPYTKQSSNVPLKTSRTVLKDNKKDTKKDTGSKSRSNTSRMSDNIESVDELDDINDISDLLGSDLDDDL